MVLNRTHDDVSTATAVQAGEGGSLDGQIIALRATPRKNNLAGATPDHGSHRVSGLVEGVKRRAPRLMRARRIAEVAGQKGGHRGKHGRVERCSSRMVHVC